MMSPLDLPLANSADELVRELARVTESRNLLALNGATLLCERATLGVFEIPSYTSAGGGCRLFNARDDVVAINLARRDDRVLLPALFATDTLDPYDDECVAAAFGSSDAAQLVARGREMGLAIAAEHETIPAPPTPIVEMTAGPSAFAPTRRAPRVIDLSALWAGPLAAHLLWLAGAQVEKVESRGRPDAMREGDSEFYRLLNQGKRSVTLDLSDRTHRRALLANIASADIVIESSRPRALAQLDIDVDQLVRSTAGLVWITITGHGATGVAGNWIGFGDDCAVAGGLSAALRAATGRTGFVGDAIADPLTGIFAALAAARIWRAGRGGRFGLAMSHVVAHCLGQARANDPHALSRSLLSWSAGVGGPFPAVQHRSIGDVCAVGSHTPAFLARTKAC